MPTQVGSVIQVQGAATTGSDSITIHAEATCLVLFVFQYSGGVSNTLDFADLNLVDFTLLVNTAEGGGIQGRVIGVLLNPATGSQTFAWEWFNATNEGGGFVIIQYKDVDLAAAVRDSDSDGVTADNLPGPLTLDSTTTDEVVGAAMCSDSNPGDSPNLGISGQTVILNDWGYTIHETDVAVVDSPGATTTSFGMQDSSATLEYSAISALSLKHIVVPGSPWNCYAQQ